MAHKQEYLDRMQESVEKLHHCAAIWRETVPVHEFYRGETVWRGFVEVFDLTGHPLAERCYAWSRPERPDAQDDQFVSVLNLPPITDARSAVRATVVPRGKGSD